MRGCTQGCRYCQAGYWYRPVRELEPTDIVKTMESNRSRFGTHEMGLLSLSTSDYSRIDDLLGYLKTKKPTGKNNMRISLPSLRADTYLEKNVGDAMEGLNTKSVTFAPETGSERLRRVINKNMTNKDIVEASKKAYNSGCKNVKLYFMLGLPSENEEDIHETCELALTIWKIGKGISPKNSVSVGFSIMSPKPFTPFQWIAFTDKESINAKLSIIRGRLRRRGLSIQWPDWETAMLESILTRGDRRLSKVIARAYQLGCQFDSWRDNNNYQRWMEAFSLENIDPIPYLREREEKEPFPWEIIDMGIVRPFFWVEYKKSFQEKTIPDCKFGPCFGCGIAPKGIDRRLAETTLKKPSPQTINDSDSLQKFTTYRLQYRKTGPIKFLSHLNLLNHFIRAFHRLPYEFKYSAGMNPRLLLSASPALTLGYESEVEWLEVHIDINAPSKWGFLLNNYLPNGLEIVSCQPPTEKTFCLNEFSAIITYHINFSSFSNLKAVQLKLEKWIHTKSWVFFGKEGKKQWEGKDIFHCRWIHNMETAKLEVEMIYHANQANPSLKLFLGEVFDLSDDSIALLDIKKNKFSPIEEKQKINLGSAVLLG